MNLLYFTTAYDSGMFGNRVHEEFLARLHERGHQATVLAPAPGRRSGPRLQIEPGTPPVVRAAVSATRAARAANFASGRLAHYDHFLTALAGYRVPGLPGLYLAGASTHPGGGVSGNSGRTAARLLLADRQPRARAVAAVASRLPRRTRPSRGGRR